MKKIPTPKVVSKEEWLDAREKLLIKEKEVTRLRDSVAAERRRLPMVKIEKQYSFDGPTGKQSLLDLFDGRSQLIMYHFMYGPDWKEGCEGCSMLADGICNLAHLQARDTSFVMVSRAKLEKLNSFKLRMGWQMPWVSSYDSDFNDDFEMTKGDDECSGTSVFITDGTDVFRTYFTTGRGDELHGSVWSLLDLTPYGRQEKWEDSPEGWPQSEPYDWWKLHDNY
jgi:predicted dithiol-disulfide oxidoreductase (DUF899 family)